MLLAVALTSCGGGNSPAQTSTPPPPPPQPITYGIDQTFEPADWTGSYHVGTVQYHWQDENRGEPHTISVEDSRELLVRLFYPTDAEYSNNRLPVIDAEFWESIGTGEFIENSLLRRSNYNDVLWNVEIEAPLSDINADYPVLIFSNGYGLTPERHVVIAAELASRGYIVVSINHPFGSGVSIFPDGRRVRALQLPDDNLGVDLELWSDDQIFVIDQLQILNQDSEDIFNSHLNLSLLGVLGHSYGGAAAYYSASKDGRITAVMNMDGTIFNSENKPLAQPFLYMQNDSGYGSEIFEQVNNDGYAVVFDRQIRHLSFADFVLFWQWDFPDTDPFGSLDSITAFSVIIDTTDQFFKKYFYGTPAPYLDEPDQQPAAIRVIRY